MMLTQKIFREIKRILRNIKKLFVKIKYYYMYFIKKDIFLREVKRWFADKGDETLRLNYPLTKDSIVFDLGGYVGDFAEKIQDKSNCQVYLFEPSKEFYSTSVQRFSEKPNIKCFQFGLSNVNGEFVLSDGADASSIKDDLVGGVVNGEIVKIRSFEEVFHELGISKIDLLKINIEGGEYDVLPHLIETGLIQQIDNIQVQFHNFIDGANENRNKIIQDLAKTHQQDWCYTFVWENWSLKKTA